MTPPAKTRDQLFEQDLAAILSCDRGTVRAIPTARGKQPWVLPLIVAAFGGFAALSLRSGSDRVMTPVLPHAHPTPPAPPPATRAARPERPDLAAAPFVLKVPAARIPAAMRSRASDRPRQSDGREMVSYQKDPTRALPITGDAAHEEKAQTDGADMETVSARDEKQRMARLEAVDAVRSLRLH